MSFGVLCYTLAHHVSWIVQVFSDDLQTYYVNQVRKHNTHLQNAAHILHVYIRQGRQTKGQREGQRSICHTWIKNSMPTAIVVPSANPRAKRLAAKADMLNCIMGWWTRRGALMSIFTELQPKAICKRRTQDAQVVFYHIATLDILLLSTCTVQNLSRSEPT